METEMENIPAIHQTQTILHYSLSLTSSDRSKHLAWIAIRVEALLDGYWQNKPTSLVKREIIADWVIGLEVFSPDEITTSCRKWLAAEPRKKPNVGDIAGLVLSERGAMMKRQTPIQQEMPKPDRVTAEQATSILEQVGFKPRRFGK